MGVSQKQEPLPSNSLKALWLYWLAGTAQGIWVISQLVKNQNESSPGGLLSISTSRLLAVGLVLLPTIFFLLLFFLHRASRPKYLTWLKHVEERLAEDRFYLLLFILCGGILISGVYLITAAPEIEEPFTRSLLENLFILQVWLSGLATQTLIFLLLLRKNTIRNIFKQKVFLFSVILIGLTFIAWAWIAKNSLPLESQVRGWNSLGVPIMETQLFFAWFISMAFLFILLFLEHQAQTRNFLARIKPTTVDLIVCFLIWIVAIFIWQSISVPTSWFVTENRPPNFEPYPNSDAYYYDISAQTALVGEGFIFFDAPYIRRPLHAAFTTLLHWLGGQNFSKVISLQLLVLAFLPVLVYLVGRAMHNRISGLLAALLILMREASSIAISGNITASHVKLLMVDVPVALMVTLFVLAVMRWLQNLHTGKLYALVAGGVLGASILIRNETVIFILPLAFLTLWIIPRGKRNQFWIKQMLLFTWGLILILAPWVWRNYSLSGKIFIDSPIMRFDLIAQRYQAVAPEAQNPSEPTPVATASSPQPEQEATADSPQSEQEALVQETPAPIPQPTAESADERYVKTVARQTLEFITGNPGSVASFIFSHYNNSQLQTLLIFPTSMRPLDSLAGFIGYQSFELLWENCCSMQNYTRRLPFWRRWDGIIPMQSSIPIILNALFLSWGFQVAWRKQKLTGLVPLAFAFTYLTMNAFFRNSGGRYILPVDWILVVYFCIGLADLSTQFMQKIFGFKMPVKFLFNNAKHEKPPTPIAILRSPAFYSLSIGFLLLASLIPLTEKAFSQRYTPDKQNELVYNLLQSELLLPDQGQAIETFLNHGGTITSGRALYPRFFREFLGEPGSTNPFGPRDYPRIGFYLAGPQYSPVILPTLTKPGLFPHASDVLVFRCSTEEVFGVAVFDEDGKHQATYLRSPLPLSLGCPFPPQDITIQAK